MGFGKFHFAAPLLLFNAPYGTNSIFVFCGFFQYALRSRFLFFEEDVDLCIKASKGRCMTFIE